MLWICITIKTFVFFSQESQTYLDSNKDYPGSLLGSWTTLYGELDQAGIIRVLLEALYVKFHFGSKRTDFLKLYHQDLAMKFHYCQKHRNEIFFWGIGGIP